MFSNIINNLLQKNNISAYKLAKDIGVSEAIISKWRNGIQEPKYDSLQKLSTYFNISADYLLELSNEPHPKISVTTASEQSNTDERKKRLLDNYDKMNDRGHKELVRASELIIEDPDNLKEDSENNKIVS